MLWLIVGITMTTIFLLMQQTSIQVWAIVYALFALGFNHFLSPGLGARVALLAGFILIGLAAITPLRKHLISNLVMRRMRRAMPKMSDTERVALEAGTVGWEAELFSGSPDLEMLRSRKVMEFNAEERAFFDGPLNTLCGMINDWDITHNHTDLPEELWHYVKEQGFLGMIIPKEYGGLGFSASAQAKILTTLYGRSVTVATTISVPNSLGPAELLLKYGTEEQKNYYLPRLAKGIDIPCFALTGPTAGSDAASIPDTGVVCYGEFKGENTLGIRLNWNKRYITLCPVATVLGLAFRLFDPDNHLGKGLDVGITCALIPAETPGITKGRRHFPLNTAFLNGPTQGKDVFIPMSYIIGDAKMAGHGWRMLMECLSAGRAISLPTTAAGGSQTAAMASGAYARVRKQFNTPIGKFEGIEEPLARIAANTYIIDAALTMTAAAIDKGAKPSVAGAILKYHTTERARLVSIDAMDIHGGKGICLGPNNYLGRGFQATPISVTVEGANILTRSLIIFGQGAIRCHPFVYKEMQSIFQENLTAFDQAFWGHVGFFVANTLQSFWYALTDARLAQTPSSKVGRYYQFLRRYSAQLAFLADFSMIVLGASLKRKEKLSARLGDLLSHLYLVSAVLLRFHQDGEPDEDLPLVNWCCQDLFFQCAQNIQDILANFPGRWASWFLKIMVQPFGILRKKPNDHLGHELAKMMTTPNPTRSRLTRNAYFVPSENCPIGRLEETFHQVCAVDSLEKRMAEANKKGLFTSLTTIEQIQEALLGGVLSEDEAKQLEAVEVARQQVIAVDDFDDSALRRAEVRQGKKKHSAVTTEST